jgi:chromosome segregation ATPase
MTINSIDDLLGALNFGSSIRQTDATTINAKSSRSHAVFSLNLIQRKSKEPSTRLKRMSMPVDSSFAEETITVDSKLHFVDLAGSERLKNTGASGERAKEGISINAGLASLGKVIAQLSVRQASGHISYRDSKLTRLLQDSLGGNAVTYMIACVNPAEFHISESLNTVQYAQRARNIQSKPKIQQVADDADKQAIIDRLRAEVNFLRDQLRNVEHSDRSPRGELNRTERSNEREIELQNHLLDVQESHQALSQRHAKLISEISKASHGTEAHLPTLTGALGDSAAERLQRSNSFSDAVEQVVLEYEKTIQSLEGSLTNTRSTLSTTESKLLERETKCTYSETVNQQLQSRLSKLMERESNTEQYLHDLEERMDNRATGEEKNSAAITDLRKEITRLREKDNNSEDYISSLEERLADANQSSDIMQSEITRLEHVVERQRSVGKLDNLLHEMEQRSTQGPVANAHASKRDRGISNATYKVAVETPIPESDYEDDDPPEEMAETNQQMATPRASRHLQKDDVARAAEQSKFVEEKLETVNQELFDLRMEHEATLSDFLQMNTKYEEAMRALAAMEEKKNQSRESSPPADLNSGARVKALKTAGQPSSSRSLSSELSSAGSRPGSWEHSNSVVHNESQTDGSLADQDSLDTPSSNAETLKALSAQKEQDFEELQREYQELNERYVDAQDEVEELKAEVQKAKLNNPPSPTNHFLRRKSSQNVMSIDRAHRSLASIGNIASETFADNPEIKDQFELHMGSLMHELHQRSERVSMLEGEIASVKKELESRMTIISGLTRERTTMKTQSPVDMSMLSSLRDQLVQSESRLQSIQEASAGREHELTAKIESLKQNLEASNATARESSEKSTAAQALEVKVRELEEERTSWEKRHETAVQSMQATEKHLRDTITELEGTLTEVETMRQQKAAELGAQTNSMSAAVAAFDLDRQKHAEAVDALQAELNTHKTTIETQTSKITELEKAHMAAQEEVKSANGFREETQSSLDAHCEQITALVKQLEGHQSAIVAYQADLQSMRDTHSAELDEIRSSTTRELEQETAARIAELNKRYEESITGLNTQIQTLETQVKEHEATFNEHKRLMDEKAIAISRLEEDKENNTRNASNASGDLETMRAKFEEVEGSKSEAEKALNEAREKLNELNAAKDKMAQELTQVRDREQRASKLVEELEGQLASTFEDSQQATSRLSLMQSAKDQELAEARAAAAKAQEEISVLTNRVSQMDVSDKTKLPRPPADTTQNRGSVQSASIDQPTNADRTSSMASRKSAGPVTTLPSPPPVIPLPPLPSSAARPSSPPGSPHGKDAHQQRVEDQDTRIRTIEKHLFAEKQLTATLEEALTDIEKDSKKVKTELETWKKKCWDAEDELEQLRKERRNNRDSLQAIEAEKAGRLRAEKAREALEARMELLNKKKKKSTLNCF